MADWGGLYLPATWDEHRRRRARVHRLLGRHDGRPSDRRLAQPRARGGRADALGHALAAVALGAMLLAARRRSRSWVLPRRRRRRQRRADRLQRRRPHAGQRVRPEHRRGQLDGLDRIPRRPAVLRLPGRGDSLPLALGSLCVALAGVVLARAPSAPRRSARRWPSRRQCDDVRALRPRRRARRLGRRGRARLARVGGRPGVDPEAVVRAIHGVPARGVLERVAPHLAQRRRDRAHRRPARGDRRRALPGAAELLGGCCGPPRRGDSCSPPLAAARLAAAGLPTPRSSSLGHDGAREAVPGPLPGGEQRRCAPTRRSAW